jgi:hypothetical protein
MTRGRRIILILMVALAAFVALYIGLVAALQILIPVRPDYNVAWIRIYNYLSEYKDMSEARIERLKNGHAAVTENEYNEIISSRRGLIVIPGCDNLNHDDAIWNGCNSWGRYYICYIRNGKINFFGSGRYDNLYRNIYPDDLSTLYGSSIDDIAEQLEEDLDNSCWGEDCGWSLRDIGAYPPCYPLD